MAKDVSLFSLLGQAIEKYFFVVDVYEFIVVGCGKCLMSN
jgi:hypothetical protein